MKKNILPFLFLLPLATVSGCGFFRQNIDTQKSPVKAVELTGTPRTTAESPTSNATNPKEQKKPGVSPTVSYSTKSPKESDFIKILDVYHSLPGKKLEELPAFIEKLPVVLSPKEYRKDIDLKILLDIKALTLIDSALSILNFGFDPERLKAEIRLQTHRGIVYMIHPLTLSYTIYPDIDAQNFEFVPDRGVTYCEASYYKNNKSIFVFKDNQPVVVPNADPKTFEPYYDAGHGLFKDKDSLFTNENCEDIFHEVKNVDIDSFKYIDNPHEVHVGKDKQYVFVGQDEITILPDADPTTFELIKVDRVAYYAKDKNHVYYATKKNFQPSILVGADPQTFQIHRVGEKYYYGSDNDDVWFYDNDSDVVEKIEGANPQTFNFEQHAKNYFDS